MSLKALRKEESPSNDIISSSSDSDDNMLGGSEEEEKVSANHETELSATKLLALREVTNDNHEKNIRLSSQNFVKNFLIIIDNNK